MPSLHRTTRFTPLVSTLLAVVGLACTIEAVDHGTPSEDRRVVLSPSVQAELAEVGVAEVRRGADALVLLDDEAVPVGRAAFDPSGNVDVTLDGDRYLRRLLADGDVALSCNQLEVKLGVAASEAFAVLRETCESPIRAAHALAGQRSDEVQDVAADPTAQDTADDRFATQTPEPEQLRAGPCVTWTSCNVRGANGGCSSSQNCQTSLRDFEAGVCHSNCVECDEPWHGC